AWHIADLKASRCTTLRFDLRLHPKWKKVSNASRAHGNRRPRGDGPDLREPGKDGCCIRRMRTSIWNQGEDRRPSRVGPNLPEWMAQIPCAPHPAPHETDRRADRCLFCRKSRRSGCELEPRPPESPPGIHSSISDWDCCLHPCKSRRKSD